MSKQIKIEIKNRWTGNILFEYLSENNTIKKTVSEAIKSEADLYGANLRETDLREADLRGANLRIYGLSYRRQFYRLEEGFGIYREATNSGGCPPQLCRRRKMSLRQSLCGGDSEYRWNQSRHRGNSFEP